jgi:hypothetical protein
MENSVTTGGNQGKTEVEAFIRSLIDDNPTWNHVMEKVPKIVEELASYGVSDMCTLADAASVSTLSSSERLLLNQCVPSAPPLMLSSLLSRSRDRPTRSLSQSTPKPQPARPIPLEVTLDKVDLNQLAEIESKYSCFKAQLYIEMLIIGKGEDEDLNAPGLVPPQPPFRGPNAAWYLSQIHVVNGKEVVTLHESTRRQGKNILMTKSVRGIFYESMELQTFPFDGQGLTITLSCLNRDGGPYPVKMRVASNFKQGIDFFGFSEHGAYLLRDFLLVDSHSVGILSHALSKKLISRRHSLVDRKRLSITPEDVEQVSQPMGKQATRRHQATKVDNDSEESYHKIFPALSVEAYVLRKPAYYIYSMSIPISALSALVFIQWAYPVVHTGRVPLAITLLLTTAAFASSIKGEVPDLGYLTLQDRHLLSNAFILFLCVIETPAVMLATGGYVQTSGLSAPSSSGSASGAEAWCVDGFGRSCELDRIFLYILAALWLSTNAWLAIHSWFAWKYSKSFMTEELVAKALANHQDHGPIRELKNVEKAHQASRRLASKRAGRRPLSRKAATSGSASMRPGAEGSPSPTSGAEQVIV